MLAFRPYSDHRGSRKDDGQGWIEGEDDVVVGEQCLTTRDSQWCTRLVGLSCDDELALPEPLVLANAPHPIVVPFVQGEGRLEVLPAAVFGANQKIQVVGEPSVSSASEDLVLRES